MTIGKAFLISVNLIYKKIKKKVNDGILIFRLKTLLHSSLKGALKILDESEEPVRKLSCEELGESFYMISIEEYNIDFFLKNICEISNRRGKGGFFLC